MGSDLANLMKDVKDMLLCYWHGVLLPNLNLARVYSTIHNRYAKVQGKNGREREERKRDSIFILVAHTVISTNDNYHCDVNSL